MSSIKYFPIFLFLTFAMTSTAFVTQSPSPPSIQRSVHLNLSPTGISDVSSVLLANYDVQTLGFETFKKLEASIQVLDPDFEAEMLSDGSYALMNLPILFSNPSKLQMRYAQMIGRLMCLGIGSLPNHGMHAEEIAVQVFLLGMSMKPIIRSIKLYRCISSSQCAEECELELSELEASVP